QAEDGIRDYKVTGVQTCALPISVPVRGVTLLGPVQIFTLTNTGTVPLAGITQATLGGANAADYFIVRLLSTCGPAGGGQLLGQRSEERRVGKEGRSRWTQYQ